MKKFIVIRKEGLKNKIKKLVTSLNFSQIFLVWLLFVAFYSSVYYITSSFSPENGLSIPGEGRTTSFIDVFYFSVITATSTGYGDIIPLGYSRVISITEVITSLILFGLLVSKIVSFKQDLIMTEIYDISLDSKVKGLRSSLHLFRSDVGKLIDSILDGTLPKRKINLLWTYLNAFQDTLIDIEELVCYSDSHKSEFIKTVGQLQIELTLNSIANSVERLGELLSQFEEAHLDWKSNKNIESMKETVSIIDRMCEHYKPDKTPASIRDRIKEIQNHKKKIEEYLMNYKGLMEFLGDKPQKKE